MTRGSYIFYVGFFINLVGVQGQDSYGIVPYLTNYLHRDRVRYHLFGYEYLREFEGKIGTARKVV